MQNDDFSIEIQLYFCAEPYTNKLFRLQKVIFDMFQLEKLMENVIFFQNFRSKTKNRNVFHVAKLHL